MQHFPTTDRFMAIETMLILPDCLKSARVPIFLGKMLPNLATAVRQSMFFFFGSPCKIVQVDELPRPASRGHGSQKPRSIQGRSYSSFGLAVSLASASM